MVTWTLASFTPEPPRMAPVSQRNLHSTSTPNLKVPSPALPSAKPSSPPMVSSSRAFSLGLIEPGPWSLKPGAWSLSTVWTLLLFATVCACLGLSPGSGSGPVAGCGTYIPGVLQRFASQVCKGPAVLKQ
ncbi:hypothetical protein G7046_g8695 [Stylonectria norvegica]|nr:hypothetical protein G7046_g8695 [Stylonectria norvegica]